MNKFTVMTIRIFLFLAVVYALYLYYPVAHRTFANLINADWNTSSGTIVAKHYVPGKKDHSIELLRNVFLLGSFIVGYFALPGIFVFYMWQLTKKIQPSSSPVRKNRRGGPKRKDHAIAGRNEKLLLNAYNQLQHIEATIDAKLAKIKEDIVTELRNEIRIMFDKKIEAEQCLGRAKTLYKSGQYKIALGECNSAVELSPSGVAHYIRGVLHHKLGMDEAALDDLKTAAHLGYQKAQDFLSQRSDTY